MSGEKVYLAARFGRRDELRGYRDELVAAGFEVTSRWLDTEHEDGSRIERIAWARMDIEDIVSAGQLVAFTEAPDSPWSRGGRHVEFGLGYAMGKRLIVVGPEENIFHTLALRFDNWAQLAHHWFRGVPR